MTVQRADTELVKHYACAGCTWPGAIVHPTDRLASGHAKATGHDVQCFLALTRTWVLYGPADDETIG